MLKSYKAQVAFLAKALNCELHVADQFRSTAMMYVEFEPPYVEVPPIENQIDYLINLHELGHVFHGHHQARPPFQYKDFYFKNGVLRSEAEAWQWAMEKCLSPLEDASRRFIWDTCLGSYYSTYLHAAGAPYRLWNGNRHHVEFIWDEPDSFFDSIVAQIQGGVANFKIEYKGRRHLKVAATPGSA